MKLNKYTSICVYIFVRKQMSVQILNEIRDDVKLFHSLEEFDLYYQKNKEKLEGKTTCILNKLFKIELPDGSVYKITKKNCGSGKGKTLTGEICLKKIQQKEDEQQQLWEIAIESVKADIANMKTKIEEIKNTVNSVVKVVNDILQQEQKY